MQAVSIAVELMTEYGSSSSSTRASSYVKCHGKPGN